MKIKFTDSFIRALKATGKNYSHGDSEHRGLMVRVSATGGKTFAMAYHAKADQRTRFLTFGRYPDVTLADGATYRLSRHRDVDQWFLDGVVD